MHWISQPGTSAGGGVPDLAARLRGIFGFPGVLNCGTHIGQAFAADEIVGVNAGEHWISIDRHADYEKTLADVQEVVDGYPGLHRDVQTYLKERIEEVLTGASEPILVRVYGDDLRRCGHRPNGSRPFWTASKAPRTRTCPSRWRSRRLP